LIFVLLELLFCDDKQLKFVSDLYKKFVADFADLPTFFFAEFADCRQITIYRLLI